jgi:hypothetical protein
LCQIRKLSVSPEASGAGGVVRVVAGIADDGGDGAGCGVGDGDVDGDLVHVLVVEGLKVKGLV